jgi:hypothetical protein
MQIPKSRCRSLSSQHRDRFVWFIIVFVCHISAKSVVQGGDPGESSNARRFNYPSILDDLVKGYTELKDVIDSHSSEEVGLVQHLWSVGRRRSVSMIEGVRSSSSIGTESSTLDIESSSCLKSSTAFDMLARSFSITLAWVVGVQATVNALFSHRQRLFEVGTPLVNLGCFVPLKLCSFHTEISCQYFTLLVGGDTFSQK